MAEIFLEDKTLGFRYARLSDRLEYLQGLSAQFISEI